MRPNLMRAITGGVLGTAVMTAMMYFVAPMMGLHMDIAQMLGSMLGNNWMTGMAMHVILWLLAQAVVMPMMGAGFFSVAR